LIRDGQNHSDIGAANGGTNGGAGCRSELSAISHRRLNRLDRLHYDQLHVQAFLTKKATFFGNKERHRSRAPGR
jgi:hypothetical protein